MDPTDFRLSYALRAEPGRVLNSKSQLLDMHSVTSPQLMSLSAAPVDSPEIMVNPPASVIGPSRLARPMVDSAELGMNIFETSAFVPVVKESVPSQTQTTKSPDKKHPQSRSKSANRPNDTSKGSGRRFSLKAEKFPSSTKGNFSKSISKFLGQKGNASKPVDPKSHISSSTDHCSDSNVVPGSPASPSSDTPWCPSSPNSSAKAPKTEVRTPVVRRGLTRSVSGSGCGIRNRTVLPVSSASMQAKMCYSEEEGRSQNISPHTKSVMRERLSSATSNMSCQGGLLSHQSIPVYSRNVYAMKNSSGSHLNTGSKPNEPFSASVTQRPRTSPLESGLRSSSADVPSHSSLAGPTRTLTGNRGTVMRGHRNPLLNWIMHSNIVTNMCSATTSSPNPSTSPLGERERASLERLAVKSARPFDDSNDEHISMLGKYWKSIFPSSREVPPIPDPLWKAAGFQSACPCTDFRGGGITSLECMLSLATQFKSGFSSLLKDVYPNATPGEVPCIDTLNDSCYAYPFSAAFINIAFLLFTVFLRPTTGTPGGSPASRDPNLGRLGRPVHGGLHPSRHSSPTHYRSRENRNSIKIVRSFIHLGLREGDEYAVFKTIFSFGCLRMHRAWCTTARQTSLLGFGSAIQEVMDKIDEVMLTQPLHITDLAAILED